MTYNKSKACVRRMQRYLDDMVNSGRTITWPSKEPEKLARRIREALWAVQFHKEFNHYASLKEAYRLRPRKGFVEAEFLLPVEAETPSATYTPERMVIEEVKEVLGIVGACINFAMRADELYFPNAKNLAKENKLSLYRWGQEEKPQWFLIDHEDEGVTMTRRVGVNKEFFWKPEV